MESAPAIIGVTLTGVAMLGALLLYIIRGEITKAGKDRQPRNGGTGWIDVHHKLDTVIIRQSDVIDDVAYLRKRLDQHIDHHEGP
jgi:hypothetical protein